MDYKANVKKIKTRDMRDSAWRTFGTWTVQKDWSCNKLMQEIKSDMNMHVST